MVYIENISVNVEFVRNLKDKRFIVLENPKYEELPDFKDKTKTISKLGMKILICEDQSQMVYYPNHGSIKTMVNLYGTNAEKWIGQLFEWSIIEKPVPYLNVLQKKIEHEEKKI